MRIVVIPSWYPTTEVPYAGSFVRSAAKAVAEAGHEVTVLFPELRSLREWRPGSGSGEMVEEDDEALKIWRWRGFRWWPRERHGSIAFSSAVRKLFCEYVAEKGPPDLVHAHVVLPAGYAAYKLASVWGVPIVLTEHAGPFSMMVETAWQRWQVRRAWEAAGAITAVSPALAANMRDAGLRRDVDIVPNTLDRIFLEPPEPARRAAGVRFLTIAAMRPGKGLEDVIEAFARIARGLPDATLTVAGDGPIRGKLGAMAAELGVADRVRLPGELAGHRAVRNTLIESDVFVLASHAETFGVTLIEALACGRPVIATRCGGPESIVGAGDGLLVDVGDVGGLSDAMRRLAGETGRYEPRALAERCWARFGPSVVARQYVAIYERVMAAQPRVDEA